MQQTQRKGSATGWIIGVIFIILTIVLVIVLIVVAQQQGWFKKEAPVEVPIPMIDLYLRANELDNHTKYHDANVEISYIKNETTIISTGLLTSGAYTPFNVPKDRAITVRCWDDDHYLVKAIKLHNPNELKENKSKMDCTSARIGHLEIKTVSGSLAHSFNTIVLNVTARDGWWYRLGMCFTWTAGIVEVESHNQWIVCESGKWFNYTKYHAENQTYDWLPANEYRCGEDNYEQCAETKANKCKLMHAETPYRMQGKVDYCSYTGKTLKKDESYIITLNVPTIDNKNSLDYLKINFYDFERRYDNQDWRWFNEFEGIDIGATDQEYTIYYKVK